METMIGSIEYLNEDRGYGFIKVDGYEKNMFFHANDCRLIRFAQLRKGDKVSIGSTKEGEKGSIATDIKLVS